MLYTGTNEPNQEVHQTEGNTMSTFTLPTTAGSIITFDGWEDLDKTTKCRYTLTLVPGGYDVKGNVFTDVVWMDMYAEEGGLRDVPEDEILAGNPAIVFEAPELPSRAVIDFDAEESRQYGSILLLDNLDYGANTVAVFVPGAMDEDGKIIEGAWINSYGAWFSQGTVEDEATALLVMGSTEDI
jgi:hypothetical protein